ncbi:MAG: molybdopterin cofactor-binding domain-containing protein [Litoreibacter sp.]
MGRLKTITRRTFFIGSAAVLGGVAFGTYLVQRSPGNPLLADLKGGEAALNPFVKITSEQIIVIAPHADKGQGVQSSQVALIAEELDVEMDQVTVEFGQPHAAYYNTALSDEAAPFMSFDESLTARTVRSAVGSVVKVMGVMVTGGSSSIPDSFDKLRTAGAVARETLKKAASEVSGIPVSELKTAKGAVQLPDGTILKYTDLAEKAAEVPPVEDVVLRDPSEWRLIGKPMERIDIVRKSTGTQDYGIDVSVEGMVYAAVRSNPRQGGEMLSYDATAAKTMRGVQRIVEIEGSILEQSSDGTMSSRFGKIGVAVITDNTWRAIQAVNAIDVEWAETYYPAEMDGHWKAVSDSFVEDKLDAEWRNDGDVEAGLQDGDVFEAEYRAPYVAHAPLEPINAVVRVDDDQIEVWAGHQMPRFAQQQIAAAAGFDDPEKVIFHNQFIGGSFGHRLEFDNLNMAAKIANQMRGTPVKLTYSREEDFAHDYRRQIAMARGKGVVANGGIETISLDLASVSASASQSSRLGQPMPGPDPQIVAGVWNMPFAVPNLRVRGYKVPELAPTSSWRSVGASSQGFFGESFVDELCHAAGVDPLEERLRLVNNDVHRKVLEAVGEMSNWGARLEEGRGRGIAIVESFGVPTAEVVEVTNTEDGIKIDKVYVVADVGQVVDPVNFDSMLKGGVIWGLGHAMNCEITYSDGMVEQENYYAHEAMRMHQCPEIITRGLENAKKIRGIGEPPVPPAAPALANAIFAATGQRLREMPFNKFIDFV